MTDREKIIELKKQIKESQDPLFCIKDIFKGRVALIVSGGPSAKDWKEIYNKLTDKNPIIISIKQAIFKTDKLNNIHFINSYNLVNYDKYYCDSLVIFSQDLLGPKPFCDFDIKYKVYRKSSDINDSLSGEKKFDEYSIDKTGLNRLWGPGIMYESVFYTLVHMGFVELHTIGWDIADNNGNNSHFYDKKSKLTNNTMFSTIIDKVFCRIKKISFTNYFLYKLGKKYNIASMRDGEAEIVSNAIPNLNMWLSNKGITLYNHSKSKWINK